MSEAVKRRWPGKIITELCFFEDSIISTVLADGGGGVDLNAKNLSEIVAKQAAAIQDGSMRWTDLIVDRRAQWERSAMKKKTGDMFKVTRSRIACSAFFPVRTGGRGDGKAVGFSLLAHPTERGEFLRRPIK